MNPTHRRNPYGAPYEDTFFDHHEMRRTAYDIVMEDRARFDPKPKPKAPEDEPWPRQDGLISHVRLIG